jgi:SpoVK/Ycf46/Vps4 family AAA+-type ATPase
LALEVGKPTAAEQQAAWAQMLGPQDKDGSTLLAAQFSLNLSTIQQLAEAARCEQADERDGLAERVWRLCCVTERPRLDALAQRLEPKATWGDLVLPATETALLRQVCAQVRQRARVYGEMGFDRKMNRGFGISTLFAGDSGTGKTMAAEVLANELRLNLYRIDLSGVVSKYIGETEKNLRRLFDAAEDGGAILFFDEADAIFGKRSEVKDSHDRYANIEINYLLQRIESYRGLAILATNMKNALDSAFLRRLRFIVNFPFPNVEDRRLLWQKAFPQRDPKSDAPYTRVAELDYERLGRFNLTGGHIHNIALNATFMAAAEWEGTKGSAAGEAGPVVTMRMVLEAARTEFLKLDRPFTNASFQCNERELQTPKLDRASEEPALV